MHPPPGLLFWLQAERVQRVYHQGRPRPRLQRQFVDDLGLGVGPPRLRLNLEALSFRFNVFGFLRR